MPTRRRGSQWLFLAFSRRERDVVVEVRGELDGCTARRLEARLRDVIDSQGNLDVVLDLKPMTFIDSAGLTVIAEASARLRGRGGALSLQAPTATALKLLELAGLEELCHGDAPASEPAGAECANDVSSPFNSGDELGPLFQPRRPAKPRRRLRARGD